MEPMKNVTHTSTNPTWPGISIDRDQWLLLCLSHTPSFKWRIGLRQFYYITRHKNNDTHGLRNVQAYSVTKSNNPKGTAVLLICCWSVLDRDRRYTGSCNIDKNYTICWMTYTHWHQTLACTSQTRIIYNLHLIHMQVFKAFLNKKWQTVLWHCECGQSITHTVTMWPGSWRKSLGQGKEFSLKAKAEIFMRCPQWSSRLRPGLEYNKTGHKHTQMTSSLLSSGLGFVTLGPYHYV